MGYFHQVIQVFIVWIPFINNENKFSLSCPVIALSSPTKPFIIASAAWPLMSPVSVPNLSKALCPVPGEPARPLATEFIIRVAVCFKLQSNPSCAILYPMMALVQMTEKNTQSEVMPLLRLCVVNDIITALERLCFWSYCCAKKWLVAEVSRAGLVIWHTGYFPSVLSDRPQGLMRLFCLFVCLFWGPAHSLEGAAHCSIFNRDSGGWSQVGYSTKSACMCTQGQFKT